MLMEERAQTHSTQELVQLLEGNNERDIAAMLEAMEFHDIVELLTDSGGYYRQRLFRLLHPDIQAEVILLLDRRTKRSLVHQLSPQTIARFLSFSDEDDAADVLQLLPSQAQLQILEKLPESKKRKINQLLVFDPETAGGIMDLNFIIVGVSESYRDVLEKINNHLTSTKEVPVVVVTDEQQHVLGLAPFKNLLGAPASTTMTQLTRHVPIVGEYEDQETLLRKIKGSHQDILVVVDKNKKPMGIVHPHDLLRVIEQEATEDLFKFAGVERNEHVFDPPRVSVRYRYRWLIVNLGTALLASFVISLFQDTISSFVVLAAYMPVVAGMGGNAGTQALAVVIRGLALGEVRPGHALVIIKKEIVTGLLDGLLVGMIIGFIVTLLHGNVVLGAILGLSLVFNLIIAGLFGSMVPLILKSLKLDPALSSSVFITTATDVFGFLIFLGLASLIIT